MPGFQMPKAETLPREIRHLTRYNGIKYEHEYFDECINRLVKFLHKAADPT
jgi:hypothetical protein